jgi:hypothetical protein
MNAKTRGRPLNSGDLSIKLSDLVALNNPNLVIRMNNRFAKSLGLKGTRFKMNKPVKTQVAVAIPTDQTVAA